MALAATSSSFVFAADEPPKDEETSKKETQALVDSLKYQTGNIDIKDKLATLKLSDKFKYLPPDQGKVLLEQIWGNPHGDRTLGILVPSDFNPLAEDSYAIVLTYEEDGYVSDKDADKIDYQKLLKEMQEGTKEYNEERVKQGYKTIELVGWATPPRYDKESHKLYWAKELKFGDSEHHTLNYNIRVLGRKGVLNLNAVAGMEQLKLIEERAPEILSTVDFNEGHRYADFNPATDKVAEYGIAALVAGGIAAKVGLFKWLWLAILSMKKLIVVAFLGVVGFFKKLFGRKSE